MTKIFIPSDKSLSIRCILLASIAVGKSKIYNILESEDIFHTRSSKKNRSRIYKRRDFIEIGGLGINGFNLKIEIFLNAGNSGTLARCILGLAQV